MAMTLDPVSIVAIGPSEPRPPPPFAGTGTTDAPGRPNAAPRARVEWFGVAGALNVVIAGWALWRGGLGDPAVEASLLCFCVAIGARNDRCVRAVFVLGRWFPSYRLHQLTYHLGQLHRAMALAGTAWFALAVVAAGTSGDGTGRTLGSAVLVVLATMAWTARDTARHARHDRFEVVHRYGGWASVVILTGLVLRHVARAAPGTGVGHIIGQPSLWLLAALIGLVVEPWIGVRRLPVEILGVTDDVVVAALPGRRSHGEFVRVSRDGRQWHSFAVATTGAEGPGRFCLVIRRAGDWTDAFGVDAAGGLTSTDLLVRRTRGYGFMYHAQTHRRVLFVATGAGIGPVLPYLIDPSPIEFECLWIGRDHRQTMGEELVERVLDSGHVTLIDTAGGRPDIGERVSAIASRFDAVFVVSNAHVRDDVARTCERIDVPWYGPTFDS